MVEPVFAVIIYKKNNETEIATIETPDRMEKCVLFNFVRYYKRERVNEKYNKVLMIIGLGMLVTVCSIPNDPRITFGKKCVVKDEMLFTHMFAYIR